MNIYLVESTSKFLIDERIKSIIKNDNLLYINALGTDLESILTEASYVSMFDEMKYLIIKNTPYFSSKIKESDEKKLLDYLTSPYPLCTVIFTTYDKVDLRKKTTKLIREKYNYISIPELKGTSLISRITDEFVQDGYRISTNNINYIITCCQGHFDLIMQEITKIKIYFNETKKIDSDELIKITSSLIQDNTFKFIDLVMEKKSKEAFLMLEDFKQLKIDPIQLLNLLARQIRLMIQCEELQNLPNRNELFKELKLQDWQYQKIMQQKSRFHLDDLKKWLIELANIDFKVKSGAADRFVELKILILEIMS